MGYLGYRFSSPIWHQQYRMSKLNNWSCTFVIAINLQHLAHLAPRLPWLTSFMSVIVCQNSSILDLWGPFFSHFWSKIWSFKFLSKNRFLTSRSHFWPKNWIFNFSTKNRFEISRDHFWPNIGRKLIFRENQESIFDLQDPFLVKKLSFSFIDQKSIWDLKDHFLAITSRINFWTRNLIFNFSIKNRFEVSRTIFGPFLVENLNFRCFDQKSIFDLQVPFYVKKLEFFIFWLKIDLRSNGPFLGHFWSKNWASDFSTKNLFLTARIRFLSKHWVFNFSTKNRFETSRDHFWANFYRKIEL